MVTLEPRVKSGPTVRAVSGTRVALAAGVLVIIGGLCLLLLTFPTFVFLPLFFMSIGHGLLLFALWRDRQVSREDPLWRLGVLFFCLSVVFLVLGLLEFT